MFFFSSGIMIRTSANSVFGQREVLRSATQTDPMSVNKKRKNWNTWRSYEMMGVKRGLEGFLSLGIVSMVTEISPLWV